MATNIVYAKKFEVGNEKFRGKIEINLKNDHIDDPSKVELSICGELYEKTKSGFWKLRNCGQCVDSIAKAIPTETTKRIVEIWRRWHLNSMHAGCIHQREFENEPYENHQGHHCDICDYTYGTSWIHEELPAEIIEEVKSF